MNLWIYEDFYSLARRCLLGWVPHSIYGIQNCLWSRKHIKNGVFRLSMYSKVSNKWHVCLYFYTWKCLGCAVLWIYQILVFRKLCITRKENWNKQRKEVWQEFRNLFLTLCIYSILCVYLFIVVLFHIEHLLYTQE